MAAINETITAGETVCAVLKRDGKIINVIEGKTPEQKLADELEAAELKVAELKAARTLTAQEWLDENRPAAAAIPAAAAGVVPTASQLAAEPDRYEIVIKLRDKLTGDTRTYKV